MTDEQDLQETKRLLVAQLSQRIDFDNANVHPVKADLPRYLLVVLGIKPSLNIDVDLVPRGLAIGAAIDRDEYWSVGFSHLACGKVLERRGQLEGAEASLSRGIQLLRRGLPVFLAYALPTYADFKCSRGERDEARRLIREARQLVEGFPDPGVLPQLIEKAERRLRLVSPPQGEPVVEELSARERSVLRLLATTLTQREIAGELYVSMNTVKSHAKSIFRKLGVSTRSEAVSRARDLALI